MTHTATTRPGGAFTFPEGFTPKLVTVLREGYGAGEFRRDLIAGLTVAVVALPLSMAIAIASGVSPDRGIFTAIVGGFFVSLLSGSRYQIGGPAGAFIVLVLATVQAHGFDGLVLATFISGMLLALAGALRLGTFVKYIPYPVTLGFTAGIGIIILASQLRPFLGLDLGGTEPGALLEKLPVLYKALPTLNMTSLLIGAFSVAIIYGLKNIAPRAPGMLVAVAVAALATWALDLQTETIGSVFGGLAQGLPAPRLPDLSLGKIEAVLPAALAFTLLGSIESLLSAVVADSMTGRRHRSNMELIAQGVANMASAIMGGICVTGTIARTATNVRAGAHGPVSGMIHAGALLLFIMLLAPLASYIPLVALAGVLVFISLHMIDFGTLRSFYRTTRAEANVMIVTMLMTIFRDLTEAIITGIALGSLLFMRRLARASRVEALSMGGYETEEEHPHMGNGGDTLVLDITGAYFFGSAPVIETVLERISLPPRRVILDLSHVPFFDMSGARSLAAFAARAIEQGSQVIIAGASEEEKRFLKSAGISDQVIFAESLAEARALALPGENESENGEGRDQAT